MQGDYRFSFILPLRAEMFRKVSTAVDSVRFFLSSSSRFLISASSPRSVGS